MSDDHNEAMRLAGELVAPIGTQTSYQTAHEAAALLRKQAARIAELEKMHDESSDVEASLRDQVAELERLSTGLSTVYNEAMDSLRIAVDERDTLWAEVERQTSALKVIYTWAGIPGALKPESVRELSGKALGKATP